ncbi:hypothetical protein CMUS01_08668 [Colletotrichum musicola]|uniref:Heterokaryon incompatibility domain-containing protein n=1 Tax=Colletotrichum musicola TaxID=2175873 RepID=A0A8H6NCG4_9PEZI|nr:hypothetical protein CMUS01_08668 [Colletotrichum musicola]
MICHTCRTRLLFYDVGGCFRSQRRALCLLHHETCRDLLQSVEAGCYICNRLWATLGSGERNIAEGPAGRPLTRRQTITDSARDGNIPVPQRAVTLLRLRQAHNSNDHYYVDIAFCPKTSSFDPESELQCWDALFSLQICQGLQASETTLPDNTKSDSSLTLAKSWVTECSMDHKQCAGTNTMPTSKWYPSRLLDIDPPGSHSNFRLIETRNSNLQGPYTTLSHCWGFKECTSLETKNYAEMLRGRPLESLPQLYPDAAYVTRQLGGDGLADWQRESAQMHDIYLNSFCNISAAHATDAHKSLFCRRDPDAHVPHAKELRVSGRNAAYSISDAYFWKTEVSEALINTRAWVLQERILAPRILYFGERHMAWECWEKDTADIFPRGVLPASWKLKNAREQEGLDSGTPKNTHGRLL